MKTMAAAKFKAQCLAVMDEVERKRESVTITKNGKAVAQLTPIEIEADPIFGFMRGRGVIVGDVLAPIVAADDWTATK